MNRLRSLLPVAFVVLALLVPTAWAGEEGDEWVGKTAPDFRFVDLDGKEVSLAVLVGEKVVWLNFWGLRCGPCVRELPALQKLHQSYGPQGLLIVGVNADGVDADFIRGQIDKRDDLKAAGVTFPIAPDPDFAAIDAYGLMGAPLNVMIDRQGVIQYRHEGYEDGDEAHYEEVVKKLLAQ